MGYPDLVFGGATIGSGDHLSTPSDVSTLLGRLLELGFQRIDTAARYPPTDMGASERLLGEAGVASKGFLVDTKVLVTMDAARPIGAGSLAPSAVRTSVADSFERLKVSKINVLYCHAPDPETPLEEQAAGLDAHFREGKFSALGVSNFPPDLLQTFIDICNENDYVRPTVYQGQYNLICRGFEDTLFPLLRKYGMVFNAYSALAGGFLTGRLTAGDIEGTRMGTMPNNALRTAYDKPEYHKVITDLQAMLEPHGITVAEAALRWLRYHSALREGDGILLGASRVSQVERNVVDLGHGPLADDIVVKMDTILQGVQ